MSLAPVLITAFNRPDKLQDLIACLSIAAPPKVVVSVDGPRPSHPEDTDAIRASLEVVKDISWTEHVEVRLNSRNLGLRGAVSAAISRCLDEHGRLIVLEDDLLPGPEALSFLNWSLEKYATDHRIGHISAYSNVPTTRLTAPNSVSRISRYPSSWGWATWSRAWKHYRDDLEDWRSWLTHGQLTGVLGHRRAVRYWEEGFDNVARYDVDSWAVPWTASLWSAGLFSVVSNRNLVEYNGWGSGTHTTGPAVYPELPLGRVAEGGFSTEQVVLDDTADAWFESHVLGTGLVKSARRRVSVARSQWLRHGTR